MRKQVGIIQITDVWQYDIGDEYHARFNDDFF